MNRIRIERDFIFLSFHDSQESVTDRVRAAPPDTIVARVALQRSEFGENEILATTQNDCRNAPNQPSATRESSAQILPHSRVEPARRAAAMTKRHVEIRLHRFVVIDPQCVERVVADDARRAFEQLLHGIQQRIERIHVRRNQRFVHFEEQLFDSNGRQRERQLQAFLEIEKLLHFAVGLVRERLNHEIERVRSIVHVERFQIIDHALRLSAELMRKQHIVDEVPQRVQLNVLDPKRLVQQFVRVLRSVFTR